MSQYYGLIKYWANYFYGKSSEQLKQTIGLDDLFQEGVVGALKAIDSLWMRNPGNRPYNP